MKTLTIQTRLNIRIKHRISTIHDTICTSPFESNHFTYHGSPLIEVVVNVQRTLFLNITGMDRIATDELFECIRDKFHFSLMPRLMRFALTNNFNR